MSDSRYPKSSRPKPTLSEFLVGEELDQATGGIIAEEDFNSRRAKLTSKKPDGTEILKRVCKEGLKMEDDKTELITTSALRFIQRVEGGKCIVFQLNRADLIPKIFERIANLKDFVNPWNKNARIAITRNLCPEDNRIRSECLSVKELLLEKGFKDVKIRFNKIISVNGGEWHDYHWFLEHKHDEAASREEFIKNREADKGREERSAEKKRSKRKAREGEESDSGTSSGSDERPESSSRKKKSKAATSSHEKPKEQRAWSGRKKR